MRDWPELPRLHKFKDCLWKINLKRNDGHIRKIAEYLGGTQTRKSNFSDVAGVGLQALRLFHHRGNVRELAA